MNHCTGLMGKTCTCGRVHGTSEGPGLAVSPWAYVLGGLCGLLWALAIWALSVYWPH